MTFSGLLLSAAAGPVRAVENGGADGLRESPEQETVMLAVKISYLAALPEGYEGDVDRRWPLVVFLHGAGQRGNDLRKITKHGLPCLVEEGKRFPFILLSPQCPEDQWWNLDALEAWLEQATRRYRIDPDRVYLTGLSMGGFATWGLAQRLPERFAAILPICGGGDAARGARLKDLPIWAFHGALDPTVPVASTTEMIAAICAAGGQPQMTIYPEALHDSWTQTYANPETLAWLLAQKRPTANASLR